MFHNTMPHNTTDQSIPDAPAARSCRWVFGDPAGEATRFCGRPIFAVSYCEEHFDRCYKKAAPRGSIGISPAPWKRSPTHIRSH